MQTIHRGLLVILQWKLRGWVIDIDFILIHVILKNDIYIFCCSILNYDDNVIFDLNVSYMSFIIISLTYFELVISFHFCLNVRISQRVIKIHFLILIYTRIYHKWINQHRTPSKQFVSHISSENWTPEQYQGQTIVVEEILIQL